MSKVKSTYKFLNGMVVTYGYDDEQIPELQGLYDKALHDKIKARSDDRTSWKGFGEIGLARAYTL